MRAKKLFLIGSLLLIAFLIRGLFFEVFILRSHSMLPGLHQGDYLFSYKAVGLSLSNLLSSDGRGLGLEKGQLVVSLAKNTNDRPSVQRIVATPGDTLSYRAGILSVNGKSVSAERNRPAEEEVLVKQSIPAEDWPYYIYRQESFSDYSYEVLDYEYGEGESFGPIKLGDDDYFVLADNRPVGRDSRAFGLLSSEDIIAVVKFQLMSCNKKYSDEEPSYWESICLPTEWDWSRVFTKTF